ncbi:hypothetical protein SAMN05660745_00681 [Corynebacterium glucuronolyticum]|nr:hypothetical protein SAMN05660745_00681 [Corynebacterium glucuronolyticum]
MVDLRMAVETAMKLTTFSLAQGASVQAQRPKSTISPTNAPRYATLSKFSTSLVTSFLQVSNVRPVRENSSRNVRKRIAHISTHERMYVV